MTGHYKTTGIALKSISLDFVTDKGEVTEHEYYGYLMAPVDLYKVIKQSFRKVSKVGEEQAGGRGQSERRKG